MVQRIQGVVFGVVISLALSFGLGLTAWAENDTQAVNTTAAKGWLEKFRPTRLELRTGYGYQDTTPHRPTHYQEAYLSPSLIIPLTGTLGPPWFRGQIEWNPELSVGSFSSPHVRPLLGFAPVQFHYAFEPVGRWFPYLVGGTGIFLAHIKSLETESHLNFNSQIGLGTRYAVTDKVSLLVEYRYGHISNAGLNGSDNGIEMHNFLVGVSMKR